MNKPNIPAAASQLHLIHGDESPTHYLTDLIKALSNPQVAQEAARLLESRIISSANKTLPSRGKERLLRAADSIGLTRGAAGSLADNPDEIADAMSRELQLLPSAGTLIAGLIEPYLPFTEALRRTLGRADSAAATKGLTGGVILSDEVKEALSILSAVATNDSLVGALAEAIAPSLSIPDYQPVTQDTPSEIPGFPEYSYYFEGGGSHGSSGGKVITLRDRVSLRFYPVPPSDRVTPEGDEVYLSFSEPGSAGTVIDRSPAWTCFFAGRLESGRKHLIMGQSAGHGALAIDLLSWKMEVVTDDGRLIASDLPTSLDPSRRHLYCWRFERDSPTGRVRFSIDGKVFYFAPSAWASVPVPELTLDTLLPDAAGDMYTLFGFSAPLTPSQVTAISKRTAVRYKTPWEGSDGSDWERLPIEKGLIQAQRAAERAAASMPSGREYLDVEEYAAMLERDCIWLSGHPRDTEIPVLAPAGRIALMTNTITDDAIATSIGVNPTQQGNGVYIPKGSGLWVTRSRLPRLYHASISIAFLPPQPTSSRQNVWEINDGAVRLEIGSGSEPESLVLVVPDDAMSSIEVGTTTPLTPELPVIVTVAISGESCRVYVNGVFQSSVNAPQSFGSRVNENAFNVEGSNFSVGRETSGGAGGGLNILSLIISANAATYPLAERFLDEYHKLDLIPQGLPIFPNPPQPVIVSASPDFLSSEVDLTGLLDEMVGFQIQISGEGPSLPFASQHSAGSNQIGGIFRYNRSGMGAGIFKTRFRLSYGQSGPYSDWIESEEATVG